MLGEVAEDVRVDLADRPVDVELDSRRHRPVRLDGRNVRWRRTGLSSSDARRKDQCKDE